VFKRLEDILKIGYAMQTLLKFILGTLTIAHWMACAWMMVQALEGSCTNWIVSYFPTKVDEYGADVDYCGPVPPDECAVNGFRQVCDDGDPSNASPSCNCGNYFEVRRQLRDLR
jgi:hypothetical protein